MKNCEYCNTENNDQATHCEKCGIAFVEQPTEMVHEEPKQEEAPLKQKKKKLLPIVLGAVALVLVAVLVVMLVLPNGKTMKSDYMFPDTTLLITNNLSETESVLVADAKIVGNPFRGNLSYFWPNLDGDVQLLTDVDSNIYVATKEGISKSIGKSGYFNLALSGNAVVFLDAENKLYLQSIPVKEEPSLLCEQATSRFAISPDGNSVAYVRKEGEASALYVYHQGEHIKIGNDLNPRAISNDAQYIYCSSMEGYSFYLADLNGTLTKMAESSWDFYLLNKNHTQLIFCGDSKWYVIDHGEKKEISNLINSAMASVNLFLADPYGAASVGEDYYTQLVTYGVENLAGKYYLTNGMNTLCYVNENWEAQEISYGLTGQAYGLSRDGNTLCYIADNTLYQVKNADINEKKQLAKDVISFVMTSDGSAVYYLDNENTAWYQKGTEKAVKLAESVYTFFLTHDDYVLLLCNDAMKFGERSKLYAVKNGSDPELIADDVYYAFVTSTATYYYAFQEEDADYAYDLYGTEKGIDFEFITKDS